MTFLLPTLIGVIIFILGQYMLKMVIEPVQAFRASLGRLSNTILRYQAKITNASVDDELSGRVHDHAADIVSTSSTIMFYRFARRVFGLPTKEGIIKAAQNLNGIAYSLSGAAREFEDSPSFMAAKPNHAAAVGDSLIIIQKELRIRTSYA
ncbi:hypothetical protein [Pseudomonas syringae]|uniref:hypothetical protein n=1 Tax=Pseudomonas syringae TaxID=317 RepID=UPI00068E9829|nr:hypothetical protein [Pseudomonas syringae]